MDRTNVLSVAKELLNAGFRVHPVYGVNPDGTCACGKPQNHPGGRGIGKHPHDLRWYHKPALLFPFQAGLHPMNIALECGPQPNGLNLFGIDFDLVSPDAYPHLKSPVFSETRRGFHFYFQVAPADTYPLRVRTAQDVTGRRKRAGERGESPYLAGGIDLKYKGGALLIEPSRRTGGQWQSRAGALYYTELNLLLAKQIPWLPATFTF